MSTPLRALIFIRRKTGMTIFKKPLFGLKNLEHAVPVLGITGTAWFWKIEFVDGIGPSFYSLISTG